MIVFTLSKGFHLFKIVNFILKNWEITQHKTKLVVVYCYLTVVGFLGVFFVVVDKYGYWKNDVNIKLYNKYNFRKQDVETIIKSTIIASFNINVHLVNLFFSCHSAINLLWQFDH